MQIVAQTDCGYSVMGRKGSIHGKHAESEKCGIM
jgi:hypothetical protein